MHKLMIALAALLILAVGANAQEPDYNNIANTIITQAAQVQPGEVVAIRGSAESLEIFEALVAATIIAGGRPIPLIEFPAANRKAMLEAPIEYLRQEHIDELAILEALDVYIEAVPGLTPARSWAGIPLERRTATQDGQASYYDAVDASSHREVYVGQSGGVPTRDFAEYIGADFEEMDGVFWRAVAVTPEELGVLSADIANDMTAGAEVHLTGPNVSDLTFRLSDEPVRINTGRVSDNPPTSGPAAASLPAGEFSACVDPTSANGVIYAPVYTFRLRDEIIGLSLTFEDGRITAMSYESGGESFSEFLSTVDAPSLALSLVSIGLNPESRIIPGSNFRSWEMGGLVTVLFGDNTIYQCAHAADFRLHPHIEGLSLTVDGKRVVRDGAILQK